MAKTGTLKLLTTSANAFEGAPLQGCLRDSQNMIDRFKPLGWEVTRLHDADMTAENMEAAVRGLVDSLGPNDAGLWHHSGHGGYLAGSEPDGRDECLFAVDLTPIRDNTVATWLEGLHRQTRLWVILDCCYSHTATRAAPLGVVDAGDSYRAGKFLTPDQWANGQTKAAAQKARTRPSGHPVARLGRSLPIFEFAACTEDEVTYDARINGVIQGCYTRALLDGLAELDKLGQGNAPINTDVQRAIRRRLPSEDYNTHPQTFATDKLHRWTFAQASGGR